MAAILTNQKAKRTKPKRPVVRYHGGKFILAEWIVANLPPHRIYIEPFGGAASVLMAKPRTYFEAYSDMDSEIVNVFRVMRDPESAAKLEHQLRLTPFARDEFELSYLTSDDSIEQARRTITRCYLGFGSTAHNRDWRTGFRSSSNGSHTAPAVDWANYPDVLQSFTDRLKGVVIENKPAIEVINEHDSPETLHYLDPPYVHSTRSKWMGRAYRHEMSDGDHRALAELVHSLKGMVVLSGYQSELYGELYGDWRQINRAHYSGVPTGRAERKEILWISPNADMAMSQPQLFV